MDDDEEAEYIFEIPGPGTYEAAHTDGFFGWKKKPTKSFSALSNQVFFFNQSN